MMDFKGTWKCRNGFTGYVEYQKDMLWRGYRDYLGGTGKAMPCSWDNNGNYIGGDTNEWDLMERLSERWSKERSGGE